MRINRDGALMLVAAVIQVFGSYLIMHAYGPNIYPPGACFANGLCTPGVNYNQWLGMVFPN